MAPLPKIAMMTYSKKRATLSFIAAFAFLHGPICPVHAEYEEPLCTSANNVFTSRINLFAGELGYYVFEECGLDVLNPTIAMEVGETYTFVQEHRTNYFHRKLKNECCPSLLNWRLEIVGGWGPRSLGHGLISLTWNVR